LCALNGCGNAVTSIEIEMTADSGEEVPRSLSLDQTRIVGLDGGITTSVFLFGGGTMSFVPKTAAGETSPDHAHSLAEAFRERPD
jgi:hypothetical protein